MRLLAAFILCASPAAAWEFTETDVCILSHSDPAAEVTIIYDPAQPLYTITLTRPEKAWPAGPDFRIRFDGNRPISIGTTRQVISDAGRTVSVSDVGFGNVLDGVEFNALMFATIGDQGVSIPLAGAEGPMADFRACPTPKAS